MTALAAILVLALATAPTAATVRGLLESVPADSLAGPLARFEAAHRGAPGVEAALALGHFHYARGEYRQAAGAFVRATPRLPSPGRTEARYWTGLSLLGAGEASQARAAFEEAVRPGSPRRAEALFGVSLCWEAARQPARALEALQTLLAGDPGEAGPAALERMVVLAGALDRPDVARRARERLARDYPGSMEAMRARPAAPASRREGADPTGAPPAGTSRAVASGPQKTGVPGPLAIQIGAFRDRRWADELARRARNAGFAPVTIQPIADARGNVYTVRAGVYATAEDARNAGIRLGRALGVPWRVVPTP